MKGTTINRSSACEKRRINRSRRRRGGVSESHQIEQETQRQNGGVKEGSRKRLFVVLLWLGNRFVHWSFWKGSVRTTATTQETCLKVIDYASDLWGKQAKIRHYDSASPSSQARQFSVKKRLRKRLPLRPRSPSIFQISNPSGLIFRWAHNYTVSK